MKKIFILLFGILFISQAYASIPIEDVFSDIGPDYKYYRELQELYDRGMIQPDIEGKFNPLKLLTREEFIGISSEVVCKNCIQPETSLELIEKYTTPVYFDIPEENQYFYCIADADELNWVRGYDPGQKCENGTFKDGERAFCPLNTITREEAYAVILRNSELFTIANNESLIASISAGDTYEPLSDDVNPRNLDGSPYTFYGYFKKALEYTLVDYDLSGNNISLSLLTLKDNKIYPKKAVTKEEFMVMAYVALRTNNCKKEKTGNDIATNIVIRNATCSVSDKTCTSGLRNTQTSIYDFMADVNTACTAGIKDYIWKFYNTVTSEKIVQHGQYLDNFVLPSSGTWKIYLRVIDACGNTGEVYNTIFYSASTDNGVTSNFLIYPSSCMKDNIDCESVGNGGAPGVINYDFAGESTGLTGNVTYTWTFTNRTTGESFTKTGEYLDNVPFNGDGIWDIQMRVTDNTNGKSTSSTGLINIDSSAGGLSGNIIIYSAECTGAQTNCVAVGNGGLAGVTSYDFVGSETGLAGLVSYTWTFINRATGESFTKTGEYLDNVPFSADGAWDVQMKATDSGGRTVSTNSLVNINSGDALFGTSVSIDAEPTSGAAPLIVQFDSVIASNTDIVSYNWNFGDGEQSDKVNDAHMYMNTGVYPVTLTIKDKNGTYTQATLTVYVNAVDMSVDSDNDGVKDIDDLCPLVAGEEFNVGCPVFGKKCNATCGCDYGYICTSSDSAICSSLAICELDTTILDEFPAMDSFESIYGTEGNGSGSYTSLSDNCLYDSGKDTIVGNIICNSCPCNLSIDYIASVRECDALFPAITSPDSVEIYSRGSIYYVK